MEHPVVSVLRESIHTATRQILESETARFLSMIDTKVPSDDRDELRLLLAERLEEIDLLSQAVSAIDSIQSWPADAATALARIAAKWFERKEPESARSILVRATALADSCEQHWQQAECILAIAEAYLTGGLATEGSDLLIRAECVAGEGERQGRPQDSIDSSGVLKRIALVLHSEGRRQEAFALARRIQNPLQRRRALRHLRKRV